MDAGCRGGLGHWSLCCAKGESQVSWPCPEAWGLVRRKAEVVWLGEVLEATER